MANEFPSDEAPSDHEREEMFVPDSTGYNFPYATNESDFWIDSTYPLSQSPVMNYPTFLMEEPFKVIDKSRDQTHLALPSPQLPLSHIEAYSQSPFPTPDK